METTDLAVDKVERYLLRLRLALGDVAAPQRDEFVREIRSHIVDRLAHEPGSSEQACEAILQTLGDPEAIACEYRSEWLMARATRLQWLMGQASRLHIPRLPLRAALRGVLAGVQWFLMVMAGVLGYTLGAAFYLTALLKPVFPRHIGLFISEEGVQLANLFPQGHEVLGPYYTPVALLLGFLLTIATRELIRWIGRRFRQMRRYL